MIGLDDAAFDKFFDAARYRMFRWEGCSSYAMPHDEPSMRAFRDGTPRPERSVATSPWLARIAAQTVREREPVTWRRVRRIADPSSLSEYDRWSLLAYVESQAAGEWIYITDRAVVDGPDFWLRDSGTPNEAAVLMHYDERGVQLGRELVEDRETLATLHERHEALLVAAEPLNVWLAKHQKTARG